MNPARWVSDVLAVRRMAVDVGKVVTTYAHRDPSSLVDVHALESADLAPFVRWLDGNGKDPLDYAVETAAKHEITLFGERHWLHDNLAFFNSIIYDLYHRAGVTCVAMEACVPEDNARLARLVAADPFDRKLALEIARNGDSWKNWGWKEYWDVFEAVWRVNQALPAGARKMRVVGMGIKFDGPSLGLSLGKSMPAGPAWEKLRLLGLVGDLAKAGMADGLYAANIARETIEKGERGVVLVGFAHASINQLWPAGVGTELRAEWARTGVMLHEKYGDRVFSIRFHNEDDIMLSDAITRFIERVASERGGRSFGCDMKGSPFGVLRDSSAADFQLQTGLCLSDIAAGYIYLKPIAEQKRCEWLNGYISEDMFAENRYYYEVKTGKSLHSPEEADQAFSAYTGW